MAEKKKESEFSKYPTGDKVILIVGYILLGLFLLAIITTCHNHKFRKMEKQNEELRKQVKKQEAELARLRQQKSGTGEKTE